MNEIVYKVMNRAAFTEAKANGSFDGSAADRRDGFIQLSSAGTLAQHFAGQKDLVLLAVDAARLGGRLGWEPSRSGAFFPHLYDALDFDALIWEEPLELGADGCHRLPLRVLP